MALGRHLQADLHGLAAAPLRDEAGLVKLLATALDDAGFHVLQRVGHRFPGAGGVTAVFLLAESHLAVHTYPEHGYLALDLFACGEARPEDVLDTLCRALGPERVEPVLTPRGRGLAPPAAPPTPDREETTLGPARLVPSA